MGRPAVRGDDGLHRPPAGGRGPRLVRRAHGGGAAVLLAVRGHRRARPGAFGDLAGHPYGDWVGTYGDPAFAAAADEARRLCDAATREVGAATRARMLAAFVRSCEHEVAFFDQVDVVAPDRPGSGVLAAAGRGAP
ncbi:hypothetical protein [Cellulomonas sp. JZ18]|uniref:hypothetical protein n=1 Tax=Cellulomonas sp. JZ18 TaxID=2654191 RepID=UPI00351AC419